MKTVDDMVRNLLTLDQDAPIFAAFHTDLDGKRVCRTRPITISRERVIDGKWVDSSRKDVPYANIVWAKQDECYESPAREAAERQSIDDGEFQRLEVAYVRALHACEDDLSETTANAASNARAALIAHIDTWGGAAPAQPLAYIAPHVMESLRAGCHVATVLSPVPDEKATEVLYGR